MVCGGGEKEQEDEDEVGRFEEEEARLDWAGLVGEEKAKRRPLIRSTDQARPAVQLAGSID